MNSSKQSINISINWRPNRVNDKNNKLFARIGFRFDDNDGNYYTLNEESYVEYKNNEYRVCGLGLEILSPFRRKRIKFRGYLLKNDKQLVYVRIRFLLLPFSRVYDFTHDFDDYFMAKELTFSPNTQNEHQFEDRIEQFCQMKGTFKEENESERVLYFWGSNSKKFLMNTTNRRFERNIIRICGYTKTGMK